MALTRVCVQEFLLSMDDSVDETEAVKRYNQYKLDFRRQQLQDFFLLHKDQEWFRSKYHPDDITTRRAESLSALKTRLGVFLFLLENSWLDQVSLDMEHAAAIVKLLDAGGHASGHEHTAFWESKDSNTVSVCSCHQDGRRDGLRPAGPRGSAHCCRAQRGRS